MKMTRQNHRLPYCARAFQFGAAASLFALVAARSLPAATVVLQDGLNGYSGATDTWLDESARHDNYGAATNVEIRLNINTVGYVDDCALVKFTLPVLSFDSVSAATLALYYYKANSFFDNNAQGIKPYRVSTTKPWYENNRNGQSGEGASWLYYGQLETEGNKWSYGSNPDYGPWYDRIDDGNGENYVKEPGGTPLQKTNAIAPPNWVPFDVLPSVQQWHGGQANNGFIVYSCYFEGDGNTLYTEYATRECSSQTLRPRLSIAYSGARISWAGTASANWDAVATNWNVGGYRGTYGNGDYVTFADGASNPAISVTGGGVTPAAVTINNAATTYSFSGGSINGSGILTKQGAGQATLAAANGYSGLTLVKTGTLIIAANNALGTTGSGTVVSNGAALGLQGGVNYASTEPLTLSGGGGGGALYAVSGNNTFAGPITLAANSSVDVDTPLSLTLNGAIGGGFNFTKTGFGTLNFGGSDANTYGGTTYVKQGMLSLVKTTGTAVPNDLVIGDGLSAAAVRLGAQNQLCSACDVTVVTSGQLELDNHSSTIGSLTLSNGTVTTGSGTLALGGPVSSTGNQTATISGNLNLGGVQREIKVSNGTAANDLVISAVISNGGIAKTDTGRLMLSGNNTSDGEVVISNGVLTVVANAALGSTAGGTTVAGGARLELRNTVTVSKERLTLNGSGGGLGALDNVSDTNIWTGEITLASSAMIECDAGKLALGAVTGSGFGITFNTTGDILINGLVSGTGSTLTKSGGGRLTLAGTGANTYSGATFVNQGMLVLGAPATIPDTPVIDVAAGATLDVASVAGGLKLGLTSPQTLKGNGTVVGDVGAKALARLEPGESAGTLTFLNNLSLTEGVTNYFELTNSLAIGGGTNDLIAVAGDLTLSSNVIAITVLGSDPLGGGTYCLFNYAGAKNGWFNPSPVFLSGAPGPGTTAWIDESVTNQVNLVVVVPVATTTLVASAPNPSLPGSNVTLTATVSPVAPATNVPTGTVTFKTNSAPLGPPVPLVNGVAVMDTTGLAHGFTPVWAEYPGQGLFLGSTGSVVQLVNTPPIGGADVAYVMKNGRLELPVAMLLGNDRDPDNDRLNMIAVSALSTNGGTAALVNGTNVVYLPKPDYVGSDLLTYTLGDPYTNVVVEICIRVLGTGDLTNRIIAITNQGGGAMTLTVARHSRLDLLGAGG